MRAAILTLLLAMVPGLALAHTWTVDSANSSIGFSGAHSGAPFNGRFETWSAQIAFDPDNLADAKVRVTIDTGSAKTGDRFQERTLGESEWFDSRRHPQATYETVSIVRLSPTRYLANGALTVKGKATPLAMPFDLSIENGVATMRARLTLDRIALGLGVESDPKAEWVSRQIPLAIEVRATR